MCGIVGAIDLHGRRAFPAAALTAMSAALTHRGPDDEGQHHEPGLAMASRRLALVDIANGHQPMPDASGEVWVSVNGELFEDEPLRRQLAAQGEVLRTRCDTELWLHLWRAHREALFPHARGQFAVALWDRASRTLLLGRDRVGICPLFVAEHDGWLLWASEIKALFASRMITPEADPRGVDTLFSFRCAPTRRTCFRGVRAVAPGHYLHVQEGRIHERRHADITFPEEGQERRADPAALTEEFGEILQRAVTRRLRGDVPVGSYLSGGLDSSTVLALAARGGRPPTAFTIGFRGAGFDERAWSHRAARAIGAEEVVVPLDRADIAHTFPALLRGTEAPVIDTSTACLLRLATEVKRRGVSVVLSGEGADEAMAGYVWYRVDTILRRVDALARLPASSALRGAALALLGGRPRRANPVAPRFPQDDLHDALTVGSHALYRPEVAAALADHDPYADLDLDLNRLPRLHPQHRAQYLDYKLLLPGLLLQAKGDRVAMSASVEVRYPFLDDEVIDFCAALAPSYKLRGVTEKWLLRQVAARVLPPALAARTKRMFTADLSPVLLGPTRPAWVDELLSPASIARAGWFDEAAVQRERRRQTWLPMLSPRRVVMDATLTGVVSTQLWHHLFLGGGLCSLPALSW